MTREKWEVRTDKEWKLELKTQELLEQKEFEVIIKILSEFFKSNSGNIYLWEIYSEALINLNQLSKALLWLDRIIETNELWAKEQILRALYNRAYIYLLRNNFDEAIKSLEECFLEDVRYLEKVMKDPRFSVLLDLKKFQEIIQPSKEFKVNEYITLKLYGKKTVIYVCGEIYSTCHTAVLSIPTEDAEYLDYDSIDEFFHYIEPITSEKLDASITPDVEFWVHCSNIQAWADFNYDTRILQDYLAFGILKKLSDNEVKDALIIFREEIIKRLKSGWINILLFFLEENYISSYLNEDDLFSSLLNQEEALAMERIAKLTRLGYTLTTDIEESYLEGSRFRSKEHFHFSMEDGYVSTLEILLDYNNHFLIIDCLRRLPRLDKLHIFYSFKPRNLGYILQGLGFELFRHEEGLMGFKKHS